jgi:hypothetical protein
MPLVGPEMKAKFQSRIHAGLSRVFSPDVGQGTNYPPIADPMWAKLADAISDIAMDIVDEIQQNAQVVPGQQVITNGGPTTQAGQTVSPGKII